MADIATLGLRVDSRDVRTADRDLDRFGRTSGRVERATDQMGTRFSGMASAASRLAAQLGAVTVASGLLLGSFRAAQEYQNMSNRFLAMGMSAEEAAGRISAIATVANQTRAPLAEMATLYNRAALSADSLGASQTDLLQFTEAVGLALSASGTSTAEASGALLQLSQALAGGVVRAEEFNSIMEGAPAIMRAAAQGIEGVNGDMGRLREMMLAGDITSEQLFSALIGQLPELRNQFDATVPTISGAMNVLRNEFTLWAGESDQAVGATAMLAEGILIVGQNMDTIIPILGGVVVAIGVIAAPISAAVVAIGAAVAAIVIYWDDIKAAWQALKSQVLDAADAAWEAFTQPFIDFWDRVSSLSFSELMAAIADSVRSGIADVLQAFSDLWDAISQEVSSWPGRLVEAGRNLISGLLEGVRASGPLARSEMRSLSRGLAEEAEDELEIRSPSRVFYRIGEQTAEGLADGIEAGTKDAVGAARNMAEQVSQAASSAATFTNGFTSALDKATLSAVQLGQQMGSTVVQGITSVTDAFGQFLVGGFESFQDFAKSILRAFQNMIAQMISIALRNRIMIGLGISGGGVGGVAQAATSGGGGLFGNLLGGAANFMGTGGTGFMGGLGNALGGGGLFNIGSNAALAGGGIGATLGAIAPLALGGLAIGLIGGLLGGGGEKTTTGSAAQVFFEGGAPRIQNIEQFDEAPGMLGNGGGTFHRIVDTDEAFVASFNEIYDGLREGVNSLAEQINIDVADGLGLWDGYSFQIDTWEKSAEEVQAAVMGKIEQMTQDYAQVVLQQAGVFEEVVREGEGAYDALQRIVTTLGSVNDMLTFFGRNLYEISVQGAVAAAELESFFGGLENMQSALNSYFENFYSQDEQFGMRLDALGREFEEIGAGLPATRQAYRDLVEAQDLSTTAGREMYAALIQLSGEFSSLVDLSEDLYGTATLLNSAFARMIRTFAMGVLTAQGALDEAQSAALDNYNAVMRIMNAQISAARQARDTIKRVFDLLSSGLESRQLLDDQAMLMRRSRLQNELRAGISDPARLTQVLGQLNQPSEQYFGTFTDFARDYFRTSNIILTQKDLAEDQLTEAQQQLLALEEQKVAIERLYGPLLDIEGNTEGLDTAISALEESIALMALATEDLNAAMNSLANALLQAISGVRGTGGVQDMGSAAFDRFSADRTNAIFANTAAETFSGVASSINEAYRQVFGRNVDAAGLNFYGGLVQDGFGISEVIADLQRSTEAMTGVIPGFASGGSHRGGLRIVGERGPEIEATGPARYYSASQTRSLMSSDPALQGEMREVNERLRELVKISHKQERRLREIELQNEVMIDQGAT